MTVAIVLRTHDRPILLARAIAGILAQTHRDWQLTIVNSGEPAPVDALVAVYRVALAHRVVVRHADAAPALADLLPGAALPAGAGHARYWALHDDDDAWHPDFLRLAVAYLESPPGRSDVAVTAHGWQVTERIEEGGIVEESRRHGFSSAHPVALSGLLTGAVLPSIFLLARTDALAAVAAAPDIDFARLVIGLALAGEIGVIPRRLAFQYRRSSRVGPYANRSALADGAAVPEVVQANRSLRELASREPALLGLLPATAALLAGETRQVTAMLDRNAGWGHGRHADLQERLIRIEAVLESLLPSEDGSNAAGSAAAARVLAGVRRVSLPPRRLLARLRGRI